ncbi:STAS domain-containing protein [Kitasatospora sp. CM 4170]|uniref:Anti-sigma factor antagonist n=1 Tax=Kitasatospora aburaviensis TaxID=67265 RepID=A0ABW1F6D5_9ACTN|nr:STAS domain-containing protein [Kitasatospora sp. CM 4170]WNM43573.1 STAS domain-containing protein [Kitasatospora sp. CM 4170]
MPRPAEQPRGGEEIGGEEADHGLRVAVGREGPVRIVTVAGELDHESADGLRSALARSVDEGIERILVDFGDLRFCDSTGLNLLLRARLDAEAAGVSLEIAGLQPVVSRLFAVTGVDTVLRIHSDLASALKASDAGPGPDDGDAPPSASTGAV